MPDPPPVTSATPGTRSAISSPPEPLRERRSKLEEAVQIDHPADAKGLRREQRSIIRIPPTARGALEVRRPEVVGNAIDLPVPVSLLRRQPQLLHDRADGDQRRRSPDDPTDPLLHLPHGALSLRPLKPLPSFCRIPF